MTENLKNLENLKEKVKIQPCVQPTDFPKTAQVLQVWFINRYTKLGKIGEKVLIILGLSYIKIQL